MAPTFYMFFRHSWVDSAGRNSLADINSGATELDSGGSSPGVQKVHLLYTVPIYF